jgi:hypothetical protein
MLDWASKEILAQGMIAPTDLKLMTVTDDPNEAVRLVVAAYEQRLAE